MVTDMCYLDSLIDELRVRSHLRQVESELEYDLECEENSPE